MWKVQNELVLDFCYHVIQLNRLSWRDFAKTEVLALPMQEKEGIMEIMTSWERDGLEKGLEQGRREGALLVMLLF